MCGLAGFINTDGLIDKKSGQKILHKMIDSLSHRGPDNKGYHIEESLNNLLAFGHSRLSIIDLSPISNQPTIYKNLVMIFNGEIYNYIEIRNKLRSYEYTFTSDGDSEVLIKAFHLWGLGALDMLNGMFSISLFNKDTKKIYLIRDRFGVKPLLYLKTSNSLFFSSEARALYGLDSVSLSISKDSIYEYVRFGYVSNPSTMMNEVKQVRPGCYLEVDIKSLSCNETEYWSVLDESKQYLNLTEKEANNTLDCLLRSSVELRLRSDVKNSIFLSGGIDSGLIAYYAAQLKSNATCLTVKFDDNFLDESECASNVANKLDLRHKIYTPTQNDYVETITMMPEIWDLPISDPSTIPTFLLCKYASNSSKVVLSADGGDELFLGYNKHLVHRFYKILSRTPFSIIRHISLSDRVDSVLIRVFNKIQKLFNLNEGVESFSFLSESINDDMIDDVLLFDTQKHKREYIKKQKKKLSSYKKIDFSAFDMNNFLTDDVLYKIDHAAMFNSIENRDPMLDYRLAAFAAALPLSKKIGFLQSKRILRKLYRSKKINTRNSIGVKKGFVPPLASIFRDNCRDQIIDCISPEVIADIGYFNIPRVINVRDKFISGDDRYFKIVWSLFTLFKWYHHWFRR